MDGQRGYAARGLGLRARVDDDLRDAVAAAWRAFWASRLLVWVAGMAAFAVFGRAPDTERFDPLDRVSGFGPIGDLVIAPAARWDSVWYLAVADLGYEQSTRTVFFPLYPALLRLGELVGLNPLGFGIAVSGGALFVALVLLYRLALLDMPPDRARFALVLVAFFPAAFVFTAVYTEALFLALSVGALYSARTDRWALAGVLGAGAAATRSAGVLLALPLLVLAWQAVPPGRRRALLSIGLVPLGLVAYLAFLGIATGEPLTPFTAQDEWNRRFVGPLGGVWEGTLAALAGVRQLLSFDDSRVFWPVRGDPFVVSLRHLALFGFLALAGWGAMAVWQRLPRAYSAYFAASLALPLSVPSATQPLLSLPRFLAVCFPLHFALALWAGERGRDRTVLGVFAVLLVIWTGLFATWVWAG